MIHTGKHNVALSPVQSDLDLCSILCFCLYPLLCFCLYPHPCFVSEWSTVATATPAQNPCSVSPRGKKETRTMSSANLEQTNKVSSDWTNLKKSECPRWVRVLIRSGLAYRLALDQHPNKEEERLHWLAKGKVILTSATEGDSVLSERGGSKRGC